MSRLSRGLNLISPKSFTKSQIIVFELGSYQTKAFFPQEKRSVVLPSQVLKNTSTEEVRFGVVENYSEISYSLTKEVTLVAPIRYSQVADIDATAALLRQLVRGKGSVPWNWRVYFLIQPGQSEVQKMALTQLVHKCGWLTWQGLTKSVIYHFAFTKGQLSDSLVIDIGQDVTVISMIHGDQVIYHHTLMSGVTDLFERIKKYVREHHQMMIAHQMVERTLAELMNLRKSIHSKKKSLQPYWLVFRGKQVVTGAMVTVKIEGQEIEGIIQSFCQDFCKEIQYQLHQSLGENFSQVMLTNIYLTGYLSQFEYIARQMEENLEMTVQHHPDMSELTLAGLTQWFEGNHETT